MSAFMTRADWNSTEPRLGFTAPLGTTPEYVGKPDKFIIGSVKVIVPGGLGGDPAEVVAEGLAIWGAALSRDPNCIKACLAEKA